MSTDIKIYYQGKKITVAKALKMKKIFVDEDGNIYLAQDVLKHIKINQTLYLN